MTFYSNFSSRVEIPSRSEILRVALAYAARDVPVFPCKVGGKQPLTLHGHLDATTDPTRIHAWFNRWPRANIGIPTGERSGIIALDHDTYKADTISRETVEAEYGSIAQTLTVRTGRGGRQYLYKHPGYYVKSRSGNNAIAPGLEAKGDGGYIIAPPSITGGSYEVVDNLPLADPPEWLLEALREPPGNVSTARNGDSPGPALLDGWSIPEGTRNSTLTSIAGRLHDGSRDLAALTDDLLAIRDVRCENPDTFTDTEVTKIACSIHTRPPAKRIGPVPTPEVLEALEEIEAELWHRDWPGMGGKSERDAYVALLKTAREHGEMIPSGVRVTIGVRTWALATAVSKRAMLDYRKKGEPKPGIITRLKKRGLLRADNLDRSGTEAGAFVLLLPPRAEFHHSPTAEAHLRTTESASGETLRGPLSAPRLRWSRPVFDGLERVGTISRLGKSKGEVVDHLEAAGGTLPLEELAGRLGVSRIRDLRRRHLAPLEAAAVVECFGDTVSLTGDWLDALNDRCEMDGEIDDYRRDMQRYEREREAYRDRSNVRPDHHPANFAADGFTEELERLPEPSNPRTLTGLINTRVGTPRGPGFLWDHKGEEARVVLDSDPSRWVSIDVSEVMLEEGVA